MRANIKVYAITGKDCKIRYNNEEYSVAYDSNSGLLFYYDADRNRLQGAYGRSPELKWHSIEGLFTSKEFTDSFVSERLFEKKPSENYRLVYSRKGNNLATVNGIKKVPNIQAMYYKKETFHYIRTNSDGEVIVDKSFETERELLNFVYSNAPEILTTKEESGKGKKSSCVAKGLVPGLIIVTVSYTVYRLIKVHMVDKKNKNR